MLCRRPRSTLFPYTTLFRSSRAPARYRDHNRRHCGNSKEANRDPEPPRLPKLGRSEEHTSELQSRFDLVCRLLLEKKKKRVRDKCFVLSVWIDRMIRKCSFF